MRIFQGSLRNDGMDPNTSEFAETNTIDDDAGLFDKLNREVVVLTP